MGVEILNQNFSIKYTLKMYQKLKRKIAALCYIRDYIVDCA